MSHGGCPPQSGNPMLRRLCEWRPSPPPGPEEEEGGEARPGGPCDTSTAVARTGRVAFLRNEAEAWLSKAVIGRDHTGGLPAPMQAFIWQICPRTLTQPCTRPPKAQEGTGSQDRKPWAPGHWAPRTVWWWPSHQKHLAPGPAQWPKEAAAGSLLLLSTQAQQSLGPLRAPAFRLTPALSLRETPRTALKGKYGSYCSRVDRSRLYCNI